ncbi:MAG: DNA repair protein RecO [Ahrensia sp.]|nr:DNA repair protein RecO [Ahrensia sp.]
MEWTDEAIVIGVRKHGESSVIAELMTLERGRHMGLVQGGRSRALRPVLQPGNSVRATWRARLDEHLGQYRLEAERLRAGDLMQAAHGIYVVQIVSALLRLLPERDAHPALYKMLCAVLDHLEEPRIAAELVVRFELAILEELGFGLDLTRCAATGDGHDLIYVSPKSGRAVSRSAGAPYQDRMLPLPSFLLARSYGDVEMAASQEIADGFALTGLFLHRHVYGPRGISAPSERESLLRMITQRGDKDA